MEPTLNSVPVTPTTHRLYGELVIHGCIYQARSDVQAVCHHHSGSVLPFCVTDVPFQPIFHLGATCGPTVPMWDSREEFGDTALVVTLPAEGQSLARALGPHWMVLMRRHGATVVGQSIQDLLFRTIFTSRNAELQSRACVMGAVAPLNDVETQKCLHVPPRTAPNRTGLGILVDATAKNRGAACPGDACASGPMRECTNEHQFYSSRRHYRSW